MSPDAVNVEASPAPVNTSRGEVAITLGGKSYVMRPSFDCLKKLEAMAGRSVVKILDRFRNQDFYGTDVAAIITAGINANPDNCRVNFDQVGEAIVSEGMDTFLATAATFATGIITAGPKAGNG